MRLQGSLAPSGLPGIERVEEYADQEGEHDRNSKESPHSAAHHGSEPARANSLIGSGPRRCKPRWPQVELASKGVRAGIHSDATCRICLRELGATRAMERDLACSTLYNRVRIRNAAHQPESRLLVGGQDKLLKHHPEITAQILKGRQLSDVGHHILRSGNLGGRVCPGGLDHRPRRRSRRRGRAAWCRVGGAGRRGVPDQTHDSRYHPQSPNRHREPGNAPIHLHSSKVWHPWFGNGPLAP